MYGHACVFLFRSRLVLIYAGGPAVDNSTAAETSEAWTAQREQRRIDCRQRQRIGRLDEGAQIGPTIPARGQQLHDSDGK